MPVRFGLKGFWPLLNNQGCFNYNEKLLTNQRIFLKLQTIKISKFVGKKGPLCEIWNNFYGR